MQGYHMYVYHELIAFIAVWASQNKEVVKNISLQYG